MQMTKQNEELEAIPLELYNNNEFDSTRCTNIVHFASFYTRFPNICSSCLVFFFETLESPLVFGFAYLYHISLERWKVQQSLSD